MLIDHFVTLLENSGYFNKVAFVRNVEDVDRIPPQHLPAVFILPAAKVAGSANIGGVTTSQSIEFKYSFCVVCKSNRNGDENLDKTLAKLTELLLGHVPNPEYHAMTYARGELHDLDSSKYIWLEEFTTRKTIRN